jgi:hypothetical protein
MITINVNYLDESDIVETVHNCNVEICPYKIEAYYPDENGKMVIEMGSGKVWATTHTKYELLLIIQESLIVSQN